MKNFVLISMVFAVCLAAGCADRSLTVPEAIEREIPVTPVTEESSAAEEPIAKERSVVLEERKAEAPNLLSDLKEPEANEEEEGEGDIPQPEGYGVTERLPAETDEEVSPDPTADGTTPDQEDPMVGTDKPAAVANPVFTPSDPGRVLVNGKKKYVANFGLSATAEPYTPPQEYESPGFSTTQSPPAQESESGLRPFIDCGKLNFIDCP